MKIKQQIRDAIRNLAGDEAGTAVTEYAMLTVFIGLSALIIYYLFPPAIVAYLERIYYVVALPFP